MDETQLQHKAPVVHLKNRRRRDGATLPLKGIVQTKYLLSCEFWQRLMAQHQYGKTLKVASVRFFLVGGVKSCLS